jgi:hypothetical protein
MAKKIAIVVTVLAASAFGLWFYLGKTPTVVSSDKASAVTDNGAVAGSATDQAASTQLPAKSMNSAQEVLETKQVSLEVFKTLDPRITALDEKEADWLRRHGYLTQEELDNLDLMSDLALDKRVGAGDTRANMLNGLKDDKKADLDGAVANYNIAAGSGSIYAIQRLADAVYRSDKLRYGTADTYDSDVYYLARLELAKYMGDHRANENQAKTVLPPNVRFGDYGRDVLFSFQERLKQYNTEYMRQHGRMPKPEPRPNAEQWRQIDSGKVPVITIVQRRRR